jgi:rod shape-determining protein MreC
MSVVGHPPPPFFRRGPAPLARFVFYVAVSLVLIVVDIRFRYLELLRQAVAVITYPLEQVAFAPVQGLRTVGGYFSSVSLLQEQNTDLRRQQVQDAAALLRQRQLEEENHRLRGLLDMKERQPAKGVVAEIVYGARDPFSRRVIIDKGGRQGIGAGQAVVDEAGVIGQVTRVFPLQSEVTLITDKNQAVPIQVVRNGLRGVLYGAGEGMLELRFLAANADVQIGDELVTSGLDGVFLPGLPVARVSSVERDTAFVFARILCAPVGGVEQHGLALVLGPREPVQAVAAEPELVHKADKPARPKRPKRRE